VDDSEMVVGAGDIPRLLSQVGRATRTPEPQNPSIHHYGVQPILVPGSWLAFMGPRSRRARCCG